MLKAIKPLLGIFGLAGISLLWITGLIMTRGVDTELLGTLFYVKLLAAAIMLATSLFMMVMGARAAKAGTPPPAYFDKLGKVSSILSIAAVALAVMVFG